MPTATPRKILVTGANGFIGSALMAWYKNSDIPVVGVDLRGNGSNILEGDIAEPCAWAQLLDECDVVIHTAALVSNAMKDKEMWKANVLATRNLLNAAAEHGVKRFVHISSIVVYGNTAVGELDENWPVHADGGSYVLTKLAAEHAVLSASLKSNMEVVIVRPGDVYGPHCRVWITLPLEMIRKRQFLLPAMGRGYFRPLFIDDLVRGITSAASVPQAAGHIINLSSEGHVTSREFFAYHHRWLSRREPWVLPTCIAYLLAELVFRLGTLIGMRSEGSGASVLQLSTQSDFSIKKASAILDWQPEVSLAEGMQRTESWLKEQKLL